ncbi:MAG: radical SAM protein [Muribaculaceae bacterium]|nr:radical SAM protein [Muribaculaceae bacterium]
MRVTFLTPPSFFHRQPAERSAGCTRVVVPVPNIYLLTLAATVRRDTGADVTLCDFTHGGNSPVTRFQHFANDPGCDFIIIWSVNLSLDDDRRALANLRARHPAHPVIFAGPGPTYAPQNYLTDPHTFVLRGEPEITACELINAIAAATPAEHIKGLSWLDTDGKIHNNPSRPLNDNLDALPFPARDLIAGRNFHNPKLKTGPYTTAFTSRNCPYHCIFCVPSSLSFAREIEHRRAHGSGHKPPVRFRSIASIDAEMSLIASQGYRAVGFMDDNFIWDEARTAAICHVMRRHGLLWGCQARADAITPAIAAMLARSGCRYVDIGVESFDDRILAYIRKGETAADIRRAVRLLAESGVSVKLNILIGSSPLETPRTVANTFREVRRLPVDQVMINIVSPFPGTEFHRMCVENGWLEGGRYVPTDVQRNSILNLPDLSARQMERLLFRHNLRFFLSPRFIVRQLGRFRSPAEFAAALHSLKLKLFG